MPLVTTEQYSKTDYYGFYSQNKNLKTSYVTNVSLIPYIRGQQLQFAASGLLTSTTVNAFFDDKRVTRLIRKPNVLVCTGVTGKFKAGDVIGYLVSGTFTVTGKVLMASNTSSTTQILYVIDDLGIASYTTTASLTNATFNASGVYQNNSASVSSGNVTAYHYSGKLPNSGSATTTVVLESKASSTAGAYVGSKFWIVGGSVTGITSIANGDYVEVTAYNPSTKTITLDTAISYTAGDVYSIGDLVTDTIGNIAGVFYLPGQYFPTGERVFRIDNRTVQHVGGIFVYTKGSETTFAESKFYAQGLTQKVQDVEYSPSIAGASNIIPQTSTQTREVGRIEDEYVTEYVAPVVTNSGCCVISTALNNAGIWSDDQKDDLIKWCEKYLHNKKLGECFRRGYQVLGSKIVVPLVGKDGLTGKICKKYINWAFTNGTNMVKGKKFSWISLPNSMLWITGFMLIGFLVTQKYANDSWKKLYK